MRINIVEITASVKLTSGQHENLLANATLTFKGELGEYFTISGFTVWKSKYDNALNVQVPQKRNFKYCLFEKSLLEKIKREIIEKYDYASIPIVEKK
ncbi:MAG TPA: hypothetical protein P5323_00180 [Candidatus Moranbacteria bacterium]|nr:hypothetical protein [Candidatus Moranbacteria bacterium]HRY27542.1 hypothetical protein [Candidatus Moranbacteria bacterium]HSA07771.1 hypothetical protein [Candidatus Moranbacteria bacterium]